ncbi:MAG: Mov34/MPN/PAD-1 family protein [Candidatus Heimdallarchaeota archaeon]
MNSKNNLAGKKKPKKNLAEIYGESKEQTNAVIEEKDTKKNNATTNAETEDEITKEKIYLVYILHRVVYETLLLCKKADPNEAIGVLLGYKYQYEDQKYVKVVDWVTGKAYQSHAFAEFTPDGVRQYTSIIEEKYGDSENRPKIVGIFHSHPFGSNPHFSATDYNTFLNFPYDTENNVFVLIDPRSNYYKSYIVVIDEKGMKDLKEVDWVEYNPK